MSNAPADRGIAGQPAGFTSLFFTELWERFSYYGMRAILLLFLVAQVSSGGMGLDDRTATAIYGLYVAGVYLASMPGGWVADRVLGAQRAIFWGGSLIALGHLILAVSRALPGFLTGLAVIVLGTGLLKPNISAMVGELNRGDNARRDAGFTVFYMAVNIGAASGPLVVAWLAQQFGWHVGFGAAAVGMVLGLAWFMRTRGLLGEAGRTPPAAPAGASRRDWMLVCVALGLLALLAVLLRTGVLQVSPVALQGGAMKVMVGLVVAYFVYLLFLAGLSAAEKCGIVVLAVLVLASTLFWAGYEQAGSSLTLFADRFTDRLIGSYEFPAGWYQFVPGGFVLLFAPVLALLWIKLGKRGRDLSVITKFSLGLLGMGLGFLVMVGAARALGPGVLAGPWWLVLTYLLHTLGELCLSPVGMSATTRLAPKRLTGQAMGLWFTSLAMGNLLASQLAGDLGTEPAGMASYFEHMFLIGGIGALVLLATLPLLKRWAEQKA